MKMCDDETLYICLRRVYKRCHKKVGIELYQFRFRNIFSLLILEIKQKTTLS